MIYSGFIHVVTNSSILSSRTAEQYSIVCTTSSLSTHLSKDALVVPVMATVNNAAVDRGVCGMRGVGLEAVLSG